MITHTPGPWIVTPQTAHIQAMITARRDSLSSSHIIAELPFCGPGGEVATEMLSEVTANAYLIAAAPVMYEALAQLMIELDEYEWMPDTDTDREYFERVKVNARAALAQAEVQPCADPPDRSHTISQRWIRKGDCTMTHTPGPWVVVKVKGKLSNQQYLALKTERGIFRLSDFHYNRSGGAQVSDTLNILAAAPDMYAALEVAEEALDAVLIRLHGHDNLQQFDHARLAIQQALSKAKGKAGA